MGDKTSDAIKILDSMIDGDAEMLAKIQTARLEAEIENLNWQLENSRKVIDALQEKISALKQSVEYNRGEVNRLLNVIAAKDWEIDSLKEKLKASYDKNTEYENIHTKKGHE